MALLFMPSAAGSLGHVQPLSRSERRSKDNVGTNIEQSIFFGQSIENEIYLGWIDRVPALIGAGLTRGNRWTSKRLGIVAVVGKLS